MRNSPARDLARTVAGFALASGIPALANLAALVLFSRALGPQQFGVYALTLSAATLIQSLVFGCWRHALIRNLHDARAEGTTGGLFSAVLRGAAASAALIALSWWIFGPSDIRAAGLAACLGLGLFEIANALHVGDLAPGRYGAMAAIRGLGGLGLGLALIAVLGGIAQAPLFAIGLAAGAAALFDWPVWIAAWKVGPDPRYQASELIRFGLPIALVTAMGATLPLIDRALLSLLIDLREAGLYAPAQDLSLQSLGLLFAVINLGAYPLALRAYRSEGKEGAARQIAQNLVAVCVLLLPGAVGLGLIAPGLASALFAPDFAAAAASIVPWLAAATFLQGLRAFVVDVAFQVTRHTPRQMFGMASVVLVGLALDLFLIPWRGAAGAAIAAVIAQTAGLAVSLTLTRPLLPWIWPWRDLSRIAIAVLIMCPAVIAARDLGFLAQAAIGCAVYGAALFVLMPRIRRLLRPAFQESRS